MVLSSASQRPHSFSLVPMPEDPANWFQLIMKGDRRRLARTSTVSKLSAQSRDQRTRPFTLRSFFSVPKVWERIKKVFKIK